MVIKDQSIEKIIQKMDGFLWTEQNISEVNNLRNEFRQVHSKEEIDNLTKEDYFAGLGKKQGCLAYDLEWGTRSLGSIKGGSKYKYGYESDFRKIKSLLQKIISIDPANVYNADGTITPQINNLINLSKEINGFKTGRTVLPKMFSIYFPRKYSYQFLMIKTTFFMNYFQVERKLKILDLPFISNSTINSLK